MNRYFEINENGHNIRCKLYYNKSQGIRKIILVPFDAGFRFAENNLIEFVPVENADHRFQNPACMEPATKKVMEFFGL